MSKLIKIVAFMLIISTVNCWEKCKITPENCDCNLKRIDGNLRQILSCENMNYTQYTEALFRLDSTKLQSLRLTNVTVSQGTSSPYTLSKLFNEVRVLQLIRTNLKMETLGDFVSSMDRLEMLKIQGDFPETTLAGDFLQRKFKNLEFISFHGGKIETVGDLNETAPNLSQLSLDDNKLSKVPVNAFANLKNIKMVSLLNNPITKIDDNTLEKLKKKSLGRLTIDSLKCDCDTYNSKLMNYLKEEDIEDVHCDEPDDVSGIDLRKLKKKSVCKGNAALGFTSSFYAIVSLCIAAILMK